MDTPTKPVPTLNVKHKTILRALLKTPVSTEFEIAKELVDTAQIHAEKVIICLPVLLGELKDMGYVWAGPIFNSTNQCLWACVLTSAGRARILSVTPAAQAKQPALK